MEFGNQYIKTFENVLAYSQFAASDDFLRPNVSYCVSENKIFYTSTTSPITAIVGDYLYSDFTVGTSTSNGKTIIGVCVIPTGKLSDGKARFISLKCMNVNTPETGSTDTGNSNIYWGGLKYDVDTIKNYNKVVIKVDGTSTLGMNGYGFLKLNSAYTQSSNQIPSPFTEFNSYKNTTVTSFNALSDFDGFGNTAKILAVDSVGHSGWESGDTVSNDREDQYCHPAARCCYMYHTAGTSKGDWYLPAMGELGFLAENRDLIRSKITAAGGADFCYGEHQSWAYLWSSSEYDDYNARGLSLSSGYVDSYAKGSDPQVFAFLAF